MTIVAFVISATIFCDVNNSFFFFGSIFLSVWGKNNEVLQTVPKVVGKLKQVIQTKEQKLSLIEGGKEGKNKLIASNQFLE